VAIPEYCGTEMVIHDGLNAQAFLSKLFDGRHLIDHDGLMLLGPRALLDHRPNCYLWTNEKNELDAIPVTYSGNRHLHSVGPMIQAFGGEKGQCCKSCVRFYEIAMLALAWLSPGKPNGWIKPNMQALGTEMTKDNCIIVRW